MNASEIWVRNWLVKYWEPSLSRRIDPNEFNDTDMACYVALEAAARLVGLKQARDICIAYRKTECGPHGTEWVSSEDVSRIQQEIEELIDLEKEHKQ